MPRLDRDSGSRRLLDFIGFLQEAGCSVTFLSVQAADSRRSRDVRYLQRLGIPVFQLPLDSPERLILESRFDVALLTFWPVAELVAPIVRRLSSSTRIMVDSVDLHFLRDARRLLYTGGSMATASDVDYEIERAGELNAYSEADLVLTVSDREGRLLCDCLGGSTPVRAAPDCEELDFSGAPMKEREGILFIGSFHHNPNIQAAEFLCRQIVPRIDPVLLDRHPVDIVGDGLNETVRGFAEGRRHIRLVGWVPSVVPYLQRARVSILPLLYGAGTKRKLVQALMTGTPTVSTGVGIEGLDLTSGEQVLVAEDAAGLSAGVSQLLVDERLCEELASKGRRAVLQTHSRPVAKRAFLAALREVLGLAPKRKEVRREDPALFERRMAYQETQRLRDALCAALRKAIPEGASLAVVAGGVAEFLRLHPFTAWEYPSPDLDAPASPIYEDFERERNDLDQFIVRGTGFLVIPAPSLIWLQERPLLRAHLSTSYPVAFSHEGVGVAYALSSSADTRACFRNIMLGGRAAAAPEPYEECVRRIRETVRRALPRDATVIVVTKGDESLLDLYGRRAWHFPQDADGAYPWYYPPDGPSVIVQLEALRVRGGQYLLFPEPALWWLERYPEFASHLYQHYPVVFKDEQTCVIFALEEDLSTQDAGSWKVRLPELIASHTDDTGQEPSILDWNTDLQLKNSFPNQAVFSPPDDESSLPYFDRSVDIVVVASVDEDVLQEARRVAGYAVLALTPPDQAFDGALSNDRDHLEVTIDRIGRRVGEGGMPSTSIVIPTHNGTEHLSLCLASLDETLPDPFDGEVIVVDDASGEEMQALLEEWQESRPHLKVVRNARNRGFVATCNRGARAAKGDVLVFLNDDTMPQAGWLQALLRTFRDHPDAGAVGGKLLYPDGRLQEAGNFVFSDGSAANFGRDDRVVEAPLYNFVREVDYCSAALLATRRSLFSEIGGFDKRYEPGYYEDTDYCFEVRRHGHRVYYQPESVVVHTEGGTGGTDLTAGAKRFQVVNQGKFAKKWKDVLRDQPKRPNQIDLAASYGLAVRASAR